MKLNVIMAVGPGGLIGADGKLPWHIREDLIRFKKLTTGNAVVMGRDTYRSLGVPHLPNRTNIVVSRHIVSTPGIMHFINPGQAVQWCRRQGFAQCFLIGGVRIFEYGFDYADRLYITRIAPELVKPYLYKNARHINIPDEGWYLTQSEKSNGVVYETWDRSHG